MVKLDDIFQAPSETVMQPLVRWWKKCLEAKEDLKVELFRPHASFSNQGTDLIVHRFVNGKEEAPEVYDWDDELNAGLVNLGVKAMNIEQEGERFSLSLRAALRKVERKYGDGYLNAVLVDLVKDSKLGSEGDIAKILQDIHSNSPDRMGRTYPDCRELIANEIGGRAVELRDKLAYNPDQVKNTMLKALAIYLDERFSVSRRRHLGFV